MSAADLDKPQEPGIACPDEQPTDVIISADTRRAKRVPPGQARTRKWPVLDASGPPRLSKEQWELAVWGLVRNPMKWNWKEFLELPRVKVFADFHCVTTWSRLGNTWEGVSTRKIVELCGGLQPEARFVLAHGYDHGWTTNVPVESLLSEDSLVAFSHDGEEIAAAHGGPARLIVPLLYAWKSAKWLGGLELMAEDKAGFWERNGYHMNGDPWAEERFR